MLFRRGAYPGLRLCRLKRICKAVGYCISLTQFFARSVWGSVVWEKCVTFRQRRLRRMFHSPSLPLEPALSMSKQEGRSRSSCRWHKNAERVEYRGLYMSLLVRRLE